MLRCYSVVLVVALMVLLATDTYADTTWVAGTIVNQTWTLTGSPYCATNNILVATLTIQPGVRVVFMGSYIFEVAGILTAVGTESDSIVFTRSQDAPGWQGILLNHLAPGTELAYCRVERATGHGVTIDHSPGVIIRSCTMSENGYSVGAWAGGGGVYVDGGATLTGCTIRWNSISSTAGGYGNCSAWGGGIYADSLTLVNCRIIGNGVYTDPEWGHGYTHGGGVYAENRLILLNTDVSYNISNAGGGGGMYDSYGYGYGGGVDSDGELTMTNCVIYHNVSAGYNGRAGGGVFKSSGGGYVTNSTVAYNADADGIRCNGDSVVIRNSICYFNAGAQIAGNTNVNYCDVQGGWTSGAGNIDFNPVFASDSCLVVQPGSQCIDHGDPDAAFNDSCFPPSLGGALNDMGAHGGPGACDWPDVNGLCGLKADETIPSLVSQYSLNQNYPNPFNPTTSISFDLPRPGMTTLTVHNLLGQNVATLLNEAMSAGRHVATFDGSALSSGLYFYTLQSGSFTESRKMLLLK